MRRKTNFTSIWGKAGNMLGDELMEAFADVFPNIAPRVDMCQLEEEIVIVVEIPGIESPEDININLNEYNLVIEGNIERPYAQNEEQMLLDERFHGAFKRKINIPRNTIPEKLSANYHRGLLIIRIPLIPEEIQRGKKINIVFDEERQNNKENKEEA